jgi:cell division protein FtsB
VNPTLIKLEREISSIADGIQRRTHFKRVLAYVRNTLATGFHFSRQKLLQTRNALAAGFRFSRRKLLQIQNTIATGWILFSRKKLLQIQNTLAAGYRFSQQKLLQTRNAFATGFLFSRQKLQIAIAYSVNWARISAVSLHRLANAIRMASRPRARLPARNIRVATSVSPAISQTMQPTAKANTLERVLISVCFGLLIVAGILVAVLYVQVKALKAELAMGQRRVAAITARVNQLEKNNQQKPGKDAALTEQPRAEIALSKADLSVIRQFIKVLPASPGAEQKIHVGDDVSNITAVPVPESLVQQLPKLRGARFSIDPSGVIVLIGEGSKKADAIVTSN